MSSLTPEIEAFFSVVGNWSSAIASSDLDSAFRVLDEAQSRKGNTPENLYVRQHAVPLRIVTLLWNKKPWKALILCIKAIRRQPDDPLPWMQLAEILQGSSRRKWAISCYRKALSLAKGEELTPTYTGFPSVTTLTYFALVELYLAEGNVEKAQRLHEESLEICGFDQRLIDEYRKLFGERQ